VRASESSEFETLWSPVVSLVDVLGSKLRAVVPNLVWTAETHASRIYPFAGNTSFSRSGAPEDEDLVLTVHATQRDPWKWTIDLARGSGEVLAETSFTTQAADREVSDSINRFVQEHRSTFESVITIS
jgi:hypothetical protein